MLEWAGEYHERLKRPRPALCLSARMTVDGKAASLARSKAKVFVEARSSKTKSVFPRVFKGNKAAIFFEDNTRIVKNNNMNLQGQIMMGIVF